MTSQAPAWNDPILWHPSISGAGLPVTFSRSVQIVLVSSRRGLSQTAPGIKIDHFLIAGSEQCDEGLISSRCALRFPLPRELPKLAR